MENNNTNLKDLTEEELWQQVLLSTQKCGELVTKIATIVTSIKEKKFPKTDNT